jgi:hypothetical protein
MQKSSVILLLSYVCLSSQFFGQQSTVWFDFNKYTCYMQGAKIDPSDLSVTTRDYWQQTTYMGIIDASGLKYYKLNTNLEFPLNGVLTKQFLVREDSISRKVFIRSLMDESTEFLLYDFSLQVGDTVKTILTEKLSYPLVVKTIDYEEYGGNKRRVFICNLQGKTSQRTIRFIEGIGTNQGFLVPIDLNTKEAIVLKCAYLNGHVILSTDKTCPDPAEMYKQHSPKTK